MGNEPKKQHVKDHLKKRKIDPKDLPQTVIDSLDTFSEAELAKVDALGTVLTDAAMDSGSKVSVVH